MAIVPGPFVTNAHDLLTSALQQQASRPFMSQVDSFSLYSLIPKFAGLLFGPAAASRFLNPSRYYLWLPSLAYMLGSFALVWRQRVPQWCWGPLSLAALQLVLPLSSFYSEMWACLAAIWFVKGNLIAVRGKNVQASEGTTRFCGLRVLVLLAVCASLAPAAFSIGGVGGFTVLGIRVLSPALVLVALCATLAYSYVPSGRLAGAAHRTGVHAIGSQALSDA